MPKDVIWKQRCSKMTKEIVGTNGNVITALTSSVKESLSHLRRTQLHIIVSSGHEDVPVSYTDLPSKWIVPTNCNRIILTRRTLSLVGRWNDGSVSWVDQSEKSDNGSAVNIGYDLDLHGLVPCTILAEDGRLFHNLGSKGRVPEDFKQTLTGYFTKLVEDYISMKEL